MPKPADIVNTERNSVVHSLQRNVLLMLYEDDRLKQYSRGEIIKVVGVKEGEGGDAEKKVLDIFPGCWRREYPVSYFICESNARQEKESEADLGAVSFLEEEERGYIKEEGIEAQAGVEKGVRVRWPDNSESKDVAFTSRRKCLR